MTAQATGTPTKAQELLIALGCAAKADPKRRFHALYDKVHRRDILNLAWLAVRANRGAPGIDRQTIQDIETQGVDEFLNETQALLKNGSYRAAPVRRVYIPKADGGQRPLGIATVRDRVVQAAVKLVLAPIFEADFMECSYGFRPGRRAHDALDAIVTNVHRDARYFVVDADIRRCFDSFDHDLLLRAVARRVCDHKMLRLIRKWVKAGVMEEGRLRTATAGTPQGGPLSPLLANAVLHGLDVMWQRKGAEYGQLIRYADDAVILCKSRFQAERAMERLRYVLGRLLLELNEEKTHIVDLRWGKEGFNFLGFHLHMRRMRARPNLTALNRWPSPKACKAFRQRVREITHPGNVGKAITEVIRDLNPVIRGWGTYFAKGQSARVFQQMDNYVRLRISILWHRKYKGRQRRWGRRHTMEFYRQLGLITLSGTTPKVGRMPAATSR